MLRIACTGWSYKDWYSGFYSRSAEKRFRQEHPERLYNLSRYSEFFDCTEINSFARIITADPAALDRLDVHPKARWWFQRQLADHKEREQYGMYERISAMAERWRASVPESFVFCSKVPGMITHAKCLQNCIKETRMFLAGLEPIRPNLGHLLYEFPAYFTIASFDALREYFLDMPTSYRYAVEFRHSSWQTEEVYAFLRKHSITLVLSEVEGPGIKSLRKPVPTTDTAYIRIIGRHGIFKRFDRMRLSESARSQLEYWAGIVRESRKGFVFLNNNFAGNAPETANLLKSMLGQKPAEWRDPGLRRYM